jgi:hypothetical protein
MHTKKIWPVALSSRPPFCPAKFLTVSFPTPVPCESPFSDIFPSSLSLQLSLPCSVREIYTAHKPPPPQTKQFLEICRNSQPVQLSSRASPKTVIAATLPLLSHGTPSDPAIFVRRIPLSPVPSPFPTSPWNPQSITILNDNNSNSSTAATPIH